MRGEVPLDFGFAGGEPVQKSLQRRRMLAFVGDRQAEEFLDRVQGLGTEAVKERPTPILGAENFGVERIGRDKIGAAEPAGEPVRGPLQFRVLIGAGAQAIPQAFVAAPMTECEQRLFIDVEERALQYRGQC